MMRALAAILLLSLPLAIAALMTEREKNGKPRPPGAPPPPNGKPPPPPPDNDKPATPPAGSLVERLPADWGADREAMILQAVKRHEYDPIRWAFVTSLGRKGGPLEGWSVQIPVMADALRFGGVRVTMDYRTAQAIADFLELQMMTPYFDALTYEQADVKPTYTAPQPVSTTTAQMVRTSQLVDDKIRKLGEDPADVYAGNVGKNWVLTKKFWQPGVHPKSKVPHSQASANHGLYVSAWNPIQNVGVFHPLDHVDSTQNLRLMGAQSIVTAPDGEQSYRPTADLITDGQLAALLTGQKGVLRGKQVGEGPLPAARHPALPLEIV